MKRSSILVVLALALGALAATTVIDLTRQVSGVLPEANGGTGSSTYMREAVSGYCTGAASTSLAVSLAHLGATATTCTTTATANAGFVVTSAGTVKNLQIHEATTQKSGTTLAWTAQKCTGGSCSATILTCTVANGGTSCSDTSNTFSVAAGDLIQIKSGTTASASETVANVAASMELWQ